MTQSNEPTTEQMNEVIALFDGWKLIKGNPELVCPSCDEGKVPQMCCICDQKNDRFQKEYKVVSRSYFRYHVSWDNLMPVWKQLAERVAALTEEGDYPADFSTIMDMYAYRCEQVDIAAAHSYVYKGIVWYNQNENQ